jgi:putative ABC transport system permease protein
MTGLVLRGLVERKLRSILTALAVLLGVAMIAGTFIQTDAINRAFGDIEKTAYKGVAAVVTPKTAFGSSFAQPKPFSDGLITRIGALPGVRMATGDLGEMGQLVVRGKPVNSSMAPSIVMSTNGAQFGQVAVDRGRMPVASAEVAIDANTASKHGVKIGDTLGVATRSGAKTVRVVGICSFGGGTSIGGATLIFAPLADIQRWYGAQHKVTEVMVGGEPGVTPVELVSRIQKVLPSGLQVRTGQAQADKETKDITNAIGGFLTPMLLALAGAALLVGAFIIFNTFSITVAQRTTEFALLRSLGATRRQVLAGVAGEALFLGVGASLAGLAAGLGFAKLLGAMFDAAGFGIPRSGLVLHPRTIEVSLVVGILVTLAAAIVPAVRATRIPPVAALQAAALPPRRSRWSPYIAGALGTVGAVTIFGGLTSSGAASSRMSTLGIGIWCVFVSVVISARWFVRPLAAVIGSPLARIFHEPGKLARENAMRNPARTAVTSAALMVGLGLVVFVSVFAAGMKASVSGSLDRYVRADLIVISDQSRALPSGAGRAIAGARDVSASSPLLIDQIKVNNHPIHTVTDTIDGVAANALLSVYRPEWIHGSDAVIKRLGATNALIEQQFAKAHHLRVGQSFTVMTSSGARARLTAIGEYKDPQMLQGVVVDRSTFSRLSSSTDPFAWIIKLRAGVSVARGKVAVQAALRSFPAAKIDTIGEYKNDVSSRLNQILYLLYALLAMSVVISLFGIANSMLLSIHERTREFGLLRAIGATRTQIRRTVRYESVITAVIGGLLGVVLGTAFAAVLTEALSDLGFVFSVPVAQLVVFLAIAVLVGVIGAVWPARRGSRVDVLKALRLE